MQDFPSSAESTTEILGLMSWYLFPEDLLCIQIKSHTVQVWSSCSHLPWASRNTGVSQKAWCVKMGSSRMKLSEGMLHHEGTPSPTCPAGTGTTQLKQRETPTAPPWANLKLSRFLSSPMSWDFSTLAFPTCLVTAGNEVWPRCCYLAEGCVQNIWCVSVCAE